MNRKTLLEIKKYVEDKELHGVGKGLKELIEGGEMPSFYYAVDYLLEKPKVAIVQAKSIGVKYDDICNRVVTDESSITIHADDIHLKTPTIIDSSCITSRVIQTSDGIRLR